MLEFSKLIDCRVILCVPSLVPKEEIVNGIVKGVEAAGIWLDSEMFAEMMHKAVKQTVLEAKPYFFVPFSAIRWAVAFSDETSVSETLLDDKPNQQ